MASGEVRGPLFRSRRPWLLLFAAFFAALYALHGSRVTPDPSAPERFFLLAGDEPHYLLVAHSLAADGDFDLYDNLRREDYRVFSERPVSGYVKDREWVLQRVGPTSTLRSAPESYWARRAWPTQPLGVSLLIAPAYRLGLAWGGRVRFAVALWLHALLAALALLMIELAWRFTGNRPAALLVPAAFVLSAPLLFYSVPAFPDLPAALLICLGVLALRSLVDGRGRAGAAAVLGCCAAALPWVHLRFLPSALLLTVAAAWPARGAPHPGTLLAGLGLPWAASLAGLAWYYQLLFGHPWPVSTAPPFSAATALGSGWPGLLFDRDHGLLAYTPLAAFAAPGVILLVRAGRRDGIAATALLLSYVGLVGANAGWNGGLSPPLRYWAPAMPLVALAASVAVARARARARGVAGTAVLLGTIGVALAAWGMLHPKLLYSSRHLLLSRGRLAALWTGLPSFFPHSRARDLAWAAGACVALGLFTLWVLRRTKEAGEAPSARAG